MGATLNLLLRPPIYGAYTELFAGLSPEITLQKTGAWSTFHFQVVLLILTWCISVIPWGRIGTLSKDINASGKSKSEGGNGRAGEFWEWSEKQVQSYL